MSEGLAKALHDLFHGVWHVDQPTNMAGSVLALPELAALIADAERVRRVREVHSPVDRGTGPQCQGCATHATFTRWPCATISVLNGYQP